MKIEELTKGPQDYKIFLDVDGVFADFDNWVLETLGERPKDEKTFWDTVKSYAKENPTEMIWGSLDLMSDAMVLWEYVKDYSPTFLTSTGTWDSKRSDKEKRYWLNKYFPGAPVITVPMSKLKANYAEKNHILVDDRMKSIGPWKAAGGIGILHKSANETINELKKLGL